MRFTEVEEHDFRVRFPGHDCAASPHPASNDLWQVILFGADHLVKPGDTILLKTDEVPDTIELRVERVRRLLRYGASTVYLLGRLTEWTETTRFHEKSEPVRPMNDIQIRNRIIWGLLESLGGKAKVAPYYLSTEGRQKPFTMRAETDGVYLELGAGPECHGLE